MEQNLQLLSNLGGKILKLLPNEYKELKPLPTFKTKISGCVTDECSCKMCKNYLENICFM